MSLRTNYKHTITASYIGYITQAVVNNFAPLLFLTFQSSFSIPLEKITSLIAINFLVQLGVDLLSAKLMKHISYRTGAILACVFSGAGLFSLGFLPYVFGNAYIGILCSVIIYAVGGGLLEVLISPIVEACPTQKKSSEMSLLHSFYCWGHVFVVLASTLFFSVFGIENWRFLAFIWSLIPFLNAVYFSVVPIYRLKSDENGSSDIKSVLSKRIFWIFIFLMICSGASEQAMSQWSSAFAESGLHVSKTLGDLFGPCLFAVLMGISRVLYSRLSEKISLRKFMSASCVLCVIGYLTASLSPVSWLSLAGCAMCGLSVGVLWPGTFSLAAENIPDGGMSMYAFFALAGDLGCMSGPSVVGAVSSAFGGNMKTGLLFALIFPVTLIILLRFLRRK